MNFLFLNNETTVIRINVQVIIIMDFENSQIRIFNVLSLFKEISSPLPQISVWYRARKMGPWGTNWAQIFCTIPDPETQLGGQHFLSPQTCFWDSGWRMKAQILKVWSTNSTNQAQMFDHMPNPLLHFGRLAFPQSPPKKKKTDTLAAGSGEKHKLNTNFLIHAWPPTPLWGRSWRNVADIICFANLNVT